MGAYLEYVSMQTADQKRFLDQRATFKGGPAHSTIFSCGPSDLVIFAVVYEIVRKLVDIIKVGRYYGFQEDISMTHVICAFSGESFKFMRGALDDAPPSTETTFRLHDALLALLLAYLQPKAAEE